MVDIRLQNTEISTEAFLERMQQGESFIHKAVSLGEGVNIELTAEHKLLFSMFDSVPEFTDKTGDGRASVGVLGARVGGLLYPFKECYKNRIHAALVDSLVGGVNSKDEVIGILSAVNSRWQERYAELCTAKRLEALRSAYDEKEAQILKSVSVPEPYTQAMSQAELLSETYPTLSDTAIADIVGTFGSYVKEVKAIRKRSEQQEKEKVATYKDEMLENKLKLESETNEIRVKLQEMLKMSNKETTLFIALPLEAKRLHLRGLKIHEEAPLTLCNRYIVNQERLSAWDDDVRDGTKRIKAGVLAETNIKIEACAKDINAQVQDLHKIEFDIVLFRTKAISWYQNMKEKHLVAEGIITADELMAYKNINEYKYKTCALIKETCKRVRIGNSVTIFTDYCVKVSQFYGTATVGTASKDAVKKAKKRLYKLLQTALDANIAFDKLELLTQQFDLKLSSDERAAVEMQIYEEAARLLSKADLITIDMTINNKVEKKLIKVCAESIKSELIKEALSGVLLDNVYKQIDDKVKSREAQRKLSKKKKETYRQGLFRRKVRAILGEDVLGDIDAHAHQIAAQKVATQDVYVRQAMAIRKSVLKSVVLRKVPAHRFPEIKIRVYTEALETILPAADFNELSKEMDKVVSGETYAYVLKEVQEFDAAWQYNCEHLVHKYKTVVRSGGLRKEAEKLRVAQEIEQLKQEYENCITHVVPAQVRNEIFEIHKTIADVLAGDLQISGMFILPTGVLLQTVAGGVTSIAVSPQDAQILNTLSAERYELWKEVWGEYLSRDLKEYDKLVKEKLNKEIAIIAGSHADSAIDWESSWLKLQQEHNLSLSAGVLENTTGSIKQSLCSHDIELLEQLAGCFGGFPVLIEISDLASFVTLAGLKDYVKKYLAGIAAVERGFFRRSKGASILNLSVLRRVSDGNNLTEVGAKVAAYFAVWLHQTISVAQRDSFAELMGDKVNISKMAFYRAHSVKVESVVERRRLMCRALFVLEYGNYIQNKSEERLRHYFDALKASTTQE